MIIIYFPQNEFICFKPNWEIVSCHNYKWTWTFSPRKMSPHIGHLIIRLIILLTQKTCFAIRYFRMFIMMMHPKLLLRQTNKEGHWNCFYSVWKATCNLSLLDLISAVFNGAIKPDRWLFSMVLPPNPRSCCL